MVEERRYPEGEVMVLQARELVRLNRLEEAYTMLDRALQQLRAERVEREGR